MKIINKAIGSFVMSLGIVIAANAAMDDDASIRERIMPVGQVNIEGAAMDSSSTMEAAAPASAREGSAIYNTSCVACHGSGVLQAPKFGDAAAWGERMAKGMDAVVSNAINGLNAMPPRGTCGDCSDEEIGAAIQYMVDNSK